MTCLDMFIECSGVAKPGLAQLKKREFKIATSSRDIQMTNAQKLINVPCCTSCSRGRSIVEKVVLNPLASLPTLCDLTIFGLDRTIDFKRKL